MSRVASNSITSHLLENQTLRIRFYCFPFPYLTLARRSKDPPNPPPTRALRRRDSKRVPQPCVSSPPLRCFFSGSRYIIFYLAERSESCGARFLLTCKSCALNLCCAGDPRRLTLGFRRRVLNLLRNKMAAGQSDTNPPGIVQRRIFVL